MNQSFEKDVVESLQQLYARFAKKVKRLRGHDYKVCLPYVLFLEQVSNNPFLYCVPGKVFDNTVGRLSFDVLSAFPLCKLDERAAQCVYEIMLCLRDYIYYSDRNLYENFTPKYASQEKVMIAMRLLKRDSIQMSGGVITYAVRNMAHRLLVSCHNR